ncbi:MAG TPA: SRPBCC domain-containing protein [Longimicrobiales bacterium]|nr:SRPBCC domain-containing protein [Longimicrobiales bacterium]
MTDEETKRPDHVVSIHIDVPVQAVWDEITKTGRVQRALYNTVLESDLQPGSRLRYYSPDRKRVFIVGEVLEVEPPVKLSHTYRFTMWKAGPPTLVTWELEEEGGGCRVTVTHSGWTAEHEAYDKTAGGWEEILDLLKRDLETGRLPLKTRVMFRVMGWFTFMLPKTTRVEHVDERGW